MAIGLEALSTELFDQVLSRIPDYDDEEIYHQFPAA
jgi:hypothetical protein